MTIYCTRKEKQLIEDVVIQIMMDSCDNSQNCKPTDNSCCVRRFKADLKFKIKET